MLKISKKFKIFFIVLMILLCANTLAFATDINMNLPAEGNANTVDNANQTNDTTQAVDNIGGTAAPSSVNSIAQENMSFSNILNILLITVGVILILLAIAILIRLKS